MTLLLTLVINFLHFVYKKSLIHYLINFFCTNNCNFKIYKIKVKDMEINALRVKLLTNKLK